MRAGEYRQQLTLQTQQPVADDGTGGGPVSYRSVTTLWGNVITQGGRELTEAQTRNAKLTHLVKTRYRTDVKPSQRLVLGETVLAVTWCGDPEGRRRELYIFCEEVARG